MAELSQYFEREDLGGGKFRHLQNLRPIAFLSNGNWARIVNAFADGDVNFPHVALSAPMLVYTAADGMRRICPTRNPQVYFEIGAPYIKPAANWTKVNLGAATRNGNQLTWTTTNADVSIQMGGHLVKLEITLKNGYVPPNGQFAFPVGLNGLTRQGTTLLANGVPVMSVNAPVVYDASNPEDTRLITMQVVNVSGQNYLLFTLPSLVGMSQPVIDPTLTLQPDATAGLDTYTRQDQSTTNFGTATVLQIRGPAANQRFILIKYDLSGIPGDAILTSAVQSLWVDAVNSGTGTARAARILAANSAWTETDATWNHAVASTVRWAGDVGLDGGTDAGCSVGGTDYSSTDMGTVPVVNATPIGTQMDITFDLTEFATLVANNYGINIRFTGSNNSITWRSSDHATAENRPRLVVDYVVANIPAAYRHRQEQGMS